MTLGQAKQIKNVKHTEPPTAEQWKELFEAEAILNAAGDIQWTTYDE